MSTKWRARVSSATRADPAAKLIASSTMSSTEAVMKWLFSMVRSPYPIVVNVVLRGTREVERGRKGTSQIKRSEQ